MLLDEKQTMLALIDADLCSLEQTADWHLHCLPLIQQFLAGSKINLFKFWDNYGKELRHLDI